MHHRRFPKSINRTVAQNSTSCSEPPKEPSKEEVPPPPPNPKDGEFITISGTIEATNPNQRPIRIDIFDGDQQNIGGKRPSVVVSTTVESGNSFEIFIPKKDQQLWVGAYIDEDNDGRPGPMDPSGWYSGNPIVRFCGSQIYYDSIGDTQ